LKDTPVHPHQPAKKKGSIFSMKLRRSMHLQRGLEPGYVTTIPQPSKQKSGGCPLSIAPLLVDEALRLTNEANN
jgi:hypothetical protein